MNIASKLKFLNRTKNVNQDKGNESSKSAT